MWKEKARSEIPAYRKYHHLLCPDSWHNADVTCSSDHILSLNTHTGPEVNTHQVQGSGSEFQMSLISHPSLPLTAMNKIFPFYPGFVSCLMCRIGRQSSECAMVFEFLIARVQPWWIVPRGGNSIVICQKEADLVRRQRQEPYRRKQTNKHAHFCPQCRLQASGSQGWGSPISTRWLPKSGKKWREDGLTCAHTHSTRFLRLRGVIESKRVQTSPQSHFSVFDWHMIFNETRIFPLSPSVQLISLWPTCRLGGPAC